MSLFSFIEFKPYRLPLFRYIICTVFKEICSLRMYKLDTYYTTCVMTLIDCNGISNTWTILVLYTCYIIVLLYVYVACLFKGIIYNTRVFLLTKCPKVLRQYK